MTRERFWFIVTWFDVYVFQRKEFERWWTVRQEYKRWRKQP